MQARQQHLLPVLSPVERVIILPVVGRLMTLIEADLRRGAQP